MKLTKMKCPSCGGALKSYKENTVVECPYCGTVLYLDDEKQPAPVTINIENYHAGQAVKAQPEEKKGSLVVATVTVLFALMAFATLLLLPNLDFSTWKEVAYQPRKIPQSVAIVQFVEAAFGKPADQITAEEYASIQYIRTYKETANDIADDLPWLISYATQVDENGQPIEVQTIGVQDKQELEVRDLQAFPNLVRVEMENGRYTWEDKYSGDYNLKNLKKLKYFKTAWNHEGKQLINGLADPTAMEEFGISYVYDTESLESLQLLTNLRRLEIGYVNEEVHDLSTLSELKKLEVLRIDHFNNDTEYDIAFLSGMIHLKELTMAGSNLDVRNLSVLYGMPQLESLELRGIKGLKELGFVQNMPNLHRLVVDSCPLTQISELNGKLSLSEVSLTDMSSLTDVSALATLTGLTKLNLTGNWNLSEVPSLSDLSSLTEAVISKRYLSALQGAAQLKRLKLVDTGGQDYSLSVLASLAQLESLTIEPGSAWIEDENVTDIIAGLPNLKELIGFADSFYKSNQDDQNSLFSSGSLEKIVCQGSDDFYDATLRLDPDTLVDNTTLKIFNMDQLKIDDARDEEWEKAYAGEYAEMILPHLQAIEELSIQSVELYDLSWAAQLPNLKRINFSDNYVKDITPLLSCPQLEEVICKDNPISNLNNLPTSVRIVQ